jgi:hypothetical protein
VRWVGLSCGCLFGSEARHPLGTALAAAAAAVGMAVKQHNHMQAAAVAQGGPHAVALSDTRGPPMPFVHAAVGGVAACSCVCSVHDGRCVLGVDQHVTLLTRYTTGHVIIHCWQQTRQEPLLFLLGFPLQGGILSTCDCLDKQQSACSASTPFSFTVCVLGPFAGSTHGLLQSSQEQADACC